MSGYWILVGMMGAGKSTVGRALAERAGVSFDDTDSMLERRFGRPISSVFRVYGEEAFREHETSILESLNPQPGVLATGGGIVMREENWTHFRRLGTTVFLDVPPQQLKERLAKSKRRRPLLEFEDWEARFDALYERRRPTYMKADIHFAVEVGELEDCASRLWTLLKEAS